MGTIGMAGFRKKKKRVEEPYCVASDQVAFDPWVIIFA